MSYYQDREARACHELVEGLLRAFDWNDSPEGPNYWVDVAAKLKARGKRLEDHKTQQKGVEE